MAAFIRDSLGELESRTRDAAEDGNVRQVRVGLRDSFREAVSCPSSRLTNDWLVHEDLGYQLGYRGGQLRLAGVAASLLAGLELQGRLRPLTVGSLQYVVGSVGPDGRVRAQVRDLRHLLLAHTAGIGRLKPDTRPIPLQAELAWFRWLASERGVLPLEMVGSDPVWVRIVSALGDIPPEIWDWLQDARLKRGWPSAS